MPFHRQVVTVTLLAGIAVVTTPLPVRAQTAAQTAAAQATDAPVSEIPAAQAETAMPAAEATARPREVNIRPAPQAEVPPAVAPLFEQAGILSPRGRWTLEPSLQYGYSSSNRVALVGYTIIPALLVGLVDVREVKRNTLTGALTARYGVSPRFELEGRLPYVARQDDTISREVGGGSAVDTAFSRNGHHLGDVELAARYQFNEGSSSMPYMVGSLRFKSRTGKDPFEVVTDCVTRCSAAGTTGLPLELPTGSGFYSLQPGLTWLFPSDPAVFFGGLSYTHNFKRQDVYRRVLSGEREFVGDVEPGGIVGLNFGMGLSLNDRSTFSLGFELNSVGPTKQNGQVLPSSVRTQLASLLMGYSFRYSDKTSLNLSVGAGLTRDTPDLTLNLRLPVTF